MKKILSNYAWLVVLTIAVNITGRFLPEGFTYPLGRLYQGIGAWLHNQGLNLPAKMLEGAAHRHLTPGNGYFLFDALSWFIIALYTVKIAKGYPRIAAILFTGLTVNNLVDELIMNPWTFEWMELVIGIIVFIICVDEYRRLKASGLK